MELLSNATIAQMESSALRTEFLIHLTSPFVIAAIVPPRRITCADPTISRMSIAMLKYPVSPETSAPWTTLSESGLKRMISPSVPGAISSIITIADRIPHVSEVSRCWPDKARMSTSAKGTSIIRPLGPTDSIMDPADAWFVVEPPPPNIAKRMTAGTAAAIEYLKRLRTTPGTSASWVVAETIVVSETGARLSPNTAPARMAANKNVGSPPTATPAGYISVQNATVVPYPVPTAVENTDARRKVSATNSPPSTPVTEPIQTSPSTAPHPGGSGRTCPHRTMQPWQSHL